MAQVPSLTWRMLSRRPPHPEVLRGLDAIWHKTLGVANRWINRRNRFLSRAERLVKAGNRHRDLPGRKLREAVSNAYGRFRLGRDTAEGRELAVALLCEVVRRELGIRPFPVQVAGMLALQTGCIVEMATGEGKTLVAAMAAVLSGWRGRGCHVITANEYLAERDAASMAPIFTFCDLSVGSILQPMAPSERKRAYDADVTYATSKEVAADFLRDRMALRSVSGLPQMLTAKMTGSSALPTDRIVQRGLESAIVDEADAVLIDEAATPLIISGAGPNPEYTDAFRQASRLTGELDPVCDYSVDQRHREIHLTETGRRKLSERAGSLGGLWAGARRREELILQALSARQFYIREKQYVIENGKVVIVDEFTGRRMPDRSWRDGLHQAVEAKEGLGISLPRATFARISFQRFFRLYRSLSGMTGTGAEARAEFWQIYHLPLVAIPTNRSCRRELLPERVFTTAQAKWSAVLIEVRRVHQTGRPVLIGTRSIEESESLSRLLNSEGLPHQVLNAVRHAEEARIISGAGERGSITVATNMAGRGTDVRLGPGVADLGGLHVIATERHESKRIDRQLYGRSSRQGDPGSSVAFTSLEDELVQRHASAAAAAWRRLYGSRGREISSSRSRRLVDIAQRRAEKASRRLRAAVLQTDIWLEESLGFAGKEFG